MSQVINRFLEEEDQSTVTSYLVSAVLSHKKESKDFPSLLEEAKASFEGNPRKLAIIMEQSKAFVGGHQIFYDRKDHLALEDLQESDDNQS